MTVNLIRKTITALKQGDFLEKVWLVLMDKTGDLKNKFKNKFFKFNGDWYHGKTAKEYELTRIKQDWWHEENRILREFLKSLPKKISVLDIPFGTGRFLSLYNENKMDVTGLDISRDMILEAKRLRGDLLKKCKIDMGDARNLPYPDNSFDIIVCFRFFGGHVTFQDAKKVISEFSRVSRKYVILELSAVSEEDSGFNLQNLPEDQPIDKSNLSEKERIELFKGFGLRVLVKKTAYSNEKPFVTIYLCEKLDSQ
ncbi:putative S-adenosyl-L-methionine-dependent methyltransferase [Candidatus Desulfarcum epimagneticum]|uniref:Putative S-adenosyl-L-methionine-dependent methyltransferase n=1 Tax=uncultured Desulfobacteraceae bacterium TaxID=218296 RepID=A0A484HGX3_9BACT|nr:putative S-adenosyl-L-methionine-dependent methyltransferase [uncultured Desulfobacteraceae bacterium]